MERGISGGVRVAFALLLLASLVVACAASDAPPSAGEPTPSANAGSIMSVVPLGGGTPVPMHLFTPDPTAGREPPPAGEMETEGFSPEATQMAQRDPPVLTVSGAQELLTFPIRTAEYVPEGYELDTWVTMLEGPMPGDAPRGVTVRYIPEGGEPFPFPHELTIEQFLGGERTHHGGLTPSAPEMVGAFEAQVYKIPEAGVVRLFWRDPELGVIYDVNSTFDKQETLRIVRSFK
ncbi:MAG: hypothetical protein OXR67_05030 [Chloroflexota bacterium]|nr:hypothetical protein [Chloroflexota bacterium]